MRNLMIGISGVRGIVGDTLTPELLTRLGAAFGTYMQGGKVVVGRDTRTSGPMIKHSVLAGLLSTGCEVVDLDICTTPSLSLMIEELEAAGGIVVSGSHNPAEWNALKFFRADGIFLNREQAQELMNIFYQGDFNMAGWDEIKTVKTDNTTMDHHIMKVLNTVNVENIRKSKIKVALDSCNGAGSIITPILLEKLGCDLVKIHCEPNGFFPHNPEPTFVNLEDLSLKVAETGADIGFAQDADADRMAIISEKGEILGEEYSVALVCDHILKKRKGYAVVNLSTTRAVDDIAKKYGSSVLRTPVGEVNVAEKMKEVNAVIGGEGNGGIIDPRVHYGRDSLIGISLILEYLAETGKKISELAAEIPKYYIEKKKIDCPRKKAVELMASIKDKYKSEKIDTTDGLKIDFADSWLHIRRSGTEPVVRIIAESKSKKKTMELMNSVLVEVEECKEEA